MDGTARPRRADARRNYDRLLAEADAAFLDHGTHASLEEVAARAGVGIGTLYRHFPTRDALLEALLRSRFDGLTARAAEVLDGRSARAALTAWARAFVETTTVYRGLTAALMATLQDEGSALHASCTAMRGAAKDLLVRAQRSGELRSDLDPTELLTLVSGVAWACEQTAGTPSRHIEHYLDLLFDGLAPR
ncbi:TetR/AcrR family transcriptional regulator [Allonocardiopsis opalescens]|uniref:TetR family transcriptional regulator n=1 Tax=Allonocardiopsis opalescens TaxID=1144618 RepID=A0A2T0PYQ0_9ACTN|nr:TetR/AcrR family transcriptional regulator [Allonocardiopsis opalescens]PRX96660.1 TetR family transcriptional regulator [Allonocardiopsis opalescens]